MKILTIGGYDEENLELKNKTLEFTKILGAEIINQGHNLINACMTEFDAVIAESAYNTLLENSDGDGSYNRIIGYVVDGKEPTHNFGKIKSSELKDWELGNPGLKIPEPIETADIIITVCGFDGAQRAANWSRIAKKPLLPIVKFGGASATIYREERNNFNNNFTHNITIDEFEDLSQQIISDSDLSKTVINLAERINVSKDAFVIMPFSEDDSLIDAYDSFKTVCLKFKPEYNCLRMDEITDVKRITPEMFNNIKSCAFVIVDLTNERPNVYYELGYADALGKPIIVTAKQGTKVHFDAKDFPIIFWSSQKKLREELTIRINQIAIQQGRLPIGK